MNDKAIARIYTLIDKPIPVMLVVLMEIQIILLFIDISMHNIILCCVSLPLGLISYLGLIAIELMIIAILLKKKAEMYSKFEFLLERDIKDGESKMKALAENQSMLEKKLAAIKENNFHLRALQGPVRRENSKDPSSDISNGTSDDGSSVEASV